ncbi:hypothetical protein APY03_1675 [Variovorax sp. WDL1]|nr:hypothetical protein APY03_1675 [Variovorax sp. WDL1]
MGHEQDPYSQGQELKPVLRGDIPGLLRSLARRAASVER